MLTDLSSLFYLSTATTSGAPSSVSIFIVGFLFVVAVLSTLALVTSLIGMFFVKSVARDAAKSAKAAEKASEPSSMTGALSSSSGQTEAGMEDRALFAVIAAAVHTAIGDRPHRVISVRSSGPGWAQEGRRQIFSSHRVR